MQRLYEILQGSKLQPEKAAQSHFLSPLGLAILRSFSLMFCLVTIGIDVSRNDPSAHHYFMFLTNLSFYTITAYFMTSFYVSWRSVNRKDFVPWGKLPWYFFLWHTAVYQLCVILTLIVTPLYWGLLAKDDLPGIAPRELYLTLSMHLFNSILMWQEVVLSKNIFVMSHIIIYLPIIIFYVPYALTLRSLTGEWAYFFLNYEESPASFAIIIAVVAIFTLVAHFSLVKLHNWRDDHFISKSARASQMQSIF